MGAALEKIKKKEREFNSWFAVSHLLFIDLQEPFFFKIKKPRSSRRGAVETNLTRNHEVAGLIPALAQRLRIQCCGDLWCRLQMRLESPVVVAVV